MSRTDRDLTGICLFGAPLDTGNLGVSALGLATLTAVARRHPAARTTVFDNGRGVRTSLHHVDGAWVRIWHRGAWISRRLHRPESLWTMAAASRLPPAVTGALQTIDRAALVLDASGGDSFTDLYGDRRLQLVAMPKEIALRRGRPLVLLPQTYGPFRDVGNARRAMDIVAAAAQAWARDEQSLDRLADLLGERYDPGRHRLGVDVAFALPARAPRGPASDHLRRWLAAGDAPVGVNVSGLLANDPGTARERFGLRADYRAATLALLRRLLDADRRVLLVAHTRGASAESDDDACASLAGELDARERVRLLPAGLDAQQLKWVIARLAWLCGARMHATIAGLSSQVPTAAVAYSDKVGGVFASCGVEDAVVDARRLHTGDLTDALWSLWTDRASLATRLETTVPSVVERADRQFDLLLMSASRRSAEWEAA